MEVHIYSSVNAKTPDIVSQRYNDNILLVKAKIKLARDLKNLCILPEIQKRVSGPGRSAARATYLSMRMHPKSCSLFPLKVATTLLCG